MERIQILNKPIEELTPKELRSRRFYQMLQKNAEKRAKKKIEEELKRKEKELLMKEKPEIYLDELKGKRLNLKKKIKKIKLFKEDTKLKR